MTAGLSPSSLRPEVYHRQCVVVHRRPGTSARPYCPRPGVLLAVPGRAPAVDERCDVRSCACTLLILLKIFDCVCQ
ncbi:hypothetical protein HOU26_gp09 [Escherichia phage IMM-002]|uniref:Uncharacterized protein n=1 Tax=Escherichia phage IMM-002 TaxID=2041760 RepID=A0A384WIG1_9CAUD|nr:hypothetical protein HOU26_gp09 [Escherichia phage IMM-002]ATI16968.1 hypothetical protein [Escherichia phage IMM-002]